MESNWRLNIYRIGMMYDGITLAARWNINYRPVFVTNRDLGPLYAETIEPLSGLNGPWHFSDWLKKPGHPHFPYGIDVEPDSPV